MNENFNKLLEIANALTASLNEMQDIVELRYQNLTDEQMDDLIQNSDVEMKITDSNTLEKGLNDYFDYLARTLAPEYRCEITQKIEMLLQKNVDVVNSYRQGIIAQAKNENELNCIYTREMKQMLIKHPPKKVNGKTKYGENHYSLNYLAYQVFSRVKNSEFAKLIPIKNPDTKEQIDESSSLKQIIRVSKKAKII